MIIYSNLEEKQQFLQEVRNMRELRYFISKTVNNTKTTITKAHLDMLKKVFI